MNKQWLFMMILVVAAVLLPLPKAYAHPPFAKISYEGMGRWTVERNGVAYPLRMIFGRGLLDAFPEETGRAHALAKEFVRKKKLADYLVFGGATAVVAGTVMSKRNSSDTLGSGDVLMLLGLGPLIAGAFKEDAALKDLFNVINVYNEDHPVSSLKEPWRWGLSVMDNRTSVLLSKRF